MRDGCEKWEEERTQRERWRSREKLTGASKAIFADEGRDEWCTRPLHHRGDPSSAAPTTTVTAITTASGSDSNTSLDQGAVFL